VTKFSEELDEVPTDKHSIWWI